jgi:vancomycin resistance protein YoaR
VEGIEGHVMRRLAFAALVVGISGTPALADDAKPPLGRFTTTYARDAEHKNRATNVELAAEAIDGKAIAPGAAFSFNDAVGERTAAFGFAKATVIRDGMMAEGSGGGTCQVASTLHAAALLAGLEIVSRAPHSRPSAYIRMGLDTTVSFPSIDLKLKNPRVERVTIHARAAKGALDVWLDGEGDKLDVSLTSEIVARTPFERVIERDKTVPDDTVRVRAFGIPGYRVRRERVITDRDGTTHGDFRIDTYAPTNEILRVAPAFDVARLAPPTADESEETPPTTPFTRDESGAQRPALVQLRPSTRVTLDNR